MEPRETHPSPKINRPMSGFDWALIALLSLLWGGSFFFVGVAVREMPPFTIVCSRVVVAAFLLLLVVYWRGERLPRNPGLWGGFFIMGLMNNLIPFSLIVWGQSHIESGLASIINGTTPIFSVVLAHFCTKEERLTPQRLTGVLMGWLGVAVLVGVTALKGVGVHVAAQLAVLGAALSYACAALYGRRFKAHSPLVVATGMLCGSAVTMVPLAMWVDQPWHLTPGTTTLVALLGLAALSTSLAYLIYFKVLASAGPTNLLLVTFLIPVNAIGLGVAFLGEHLEWSAFLGMGMIFIGLAVLDGRWTKLFSRKSDPT